jgi:aspartate/methionine/tyrosine aminotransferase
LHRRSLLAAPTWQGEEAWFHAMKDRCGVVLTPGRAQLAPEPGYFRLCYAAQPPHVLAEALRRLEALIGEVRGGRGGGA